VDKKEIMDLMMLAKKMEFKDAKYKLQNLIYVSGITGQDILRQIYNNIDLLDLSQQSEMELMKIISEVDFRLTEGASPDIQIATILANIGILK